jgi:hypothetical protein
MPWRLASRVPSHSFRPDFSEASAIANPPPENE